MHILVISQFYSPDITAAAFRIRETVDLLKNAGHDVRVITAEPHKSDRDADRLADQREGVRRVYVSPIHNGGMRNHLNHYFSFVRGSLWVGIRQRFGSWRPDVIWASSPPLFVGLTGRALAYLFGCPLVFDIRDIWPQSAVAAGQISQGGPAFKLGLSLEQRLYNTADHITCVSQPMAKYIATKSNTPTTVIYNGVLTYATEGLVKAEAGRRKRILYAGNMGRVQGLDVIIRAFATAIANDGLPGWRLELIGGGALEEELRTLIEELSLSNRITLRSSIDKHEVLQELASSAALVINLKADKVFELTIPSKVFDYMSVGRPILFGITGEGADILHATGANIAFEPNNPESFVQALEILDDRLTALEIKAEKNPITVRGTYSRETNTEKLVEVFKTISGRMI